MNDQTEVAPLSKSQRKKLAAAEHNKTANLSRKVGMEPRGENQVMVVLPEETLLTAEQHAELEALSLEVFRSTYRYKTILQKGIVEAVTEEVTEYVPAVLDADGKEVKAEETRVVNVPVKWRSPKRGLTSLNQLKTVKHNYESVKALMLEIKRQNDAFKAMIAKMEADKKAKAEQAKLQEAVQKHVGGSAL